MPENMSKPSMLPAPNRFQYAHSLLFIMSKLHKIKSNAQCFML